MMLDSPGVQRHRVRALGEPSRRRLNRLRRHAGVFGRRPRVPLADALRHRVEPRGVLRDKLSILQPIAQNHVQHAQEEDEVRPRPHRQIQVRVPADRRHPRIRHNQPRPVVARAPDVVRRNRRTLADVRPGHENHVCRRDVAPRNRTPVEVERQLIRRARRNHAQPAVVVDVPRPQRQPRELADQIRLLGDQRRPAEHRH